MSQILSDQHDNRLTEEEIQYLGIIRSSGEDLLRQINDILDLSKVEAGKMDVHPEEISVQEVGHILSHQFQWVAEQRSIEFELDVSDRLPDMITTDGMRLNQILKNLLSNAFKFTEFGKVTLRIEPAEWRIEINGSLFR